MKNTAAWIGIAGALSMAVCDMLLLAQPVSGSFYDLSSFGAMTHISRERALAGSTFGLVSAFFICFGFWYLMQLFHPVNSQQAVLLFVASCSVEFFGGAFHAAYFFIASPVRIPPDIVLDFTQHLERLSYLGVPGYIVASIVFYKLAMDERYPKWFRWANPLFIHGCLLLLFMLMPAPVGGYLKPTFINTGLALFFAFSLWAGTKSTEGTAPKKY